MGLPATCSTYSPACGSDAFATYAARDVAIQSVTESVASSDGPLDGLALQTDNGPQYTSDEFKGSMKALEIEHGHLAQHPAAAAT